MTRFHDRVSIKLRAGKGGNGIVAWRKEKFIPKGGPSGGNGGIGGNVQLQASKDIFSLDHLTNNQLYFAKNGVQGGPNRRQGKKGESLILKVPCGTQVFQNGKLILDITKHLQTVDMCEGGLGGRGNYTFKTSKRRAPNYCTFGKEGEEKDISLELKLLADVGFVGLPNAGKSTLLNAISAKKVKTGDYPFTTLTPNLRVLEFEDYRRLQIADIPGIIENASQNKGLGLRFLQHIERCSLLVFVLDATNNPLETYKLLLNELNNHNASLLQKPRLVILNKSDLLETPPQFDSETEHLALSAKKNLGIPKFLDALHSCAKRLRLS